MSHPAADVLAALLTLAGSAPALAGVRIFDGPPLADVEDQDAVALGLSIDDVAGAVGDSRPGWGDDRQETFDLAGLTQSWSGDVDMAPRRLRALQLLDAVRSLIVADPQVGGTCMRAYLGRWTYRPEQSSAGSLAVVTFAIRVAARRFEGA